MDGIQYLLVVVAARQEHEMLPKEDSDMALDLVENKRCRSWSMASWMILKCDPFLPHFGMFCYGCDSRRFLVRQGMQPLCGCGCCN